MNISVRGARLLSGLTQQAIAEKLNISRDTYRKIELNPESATISQAKQIAQVTGVSINEIFFGQNST